ncbi:MAG: hypothetical protein HC861_10140 [Rhodospirillaceae bacterium]|nr:hypothetical protein [Rhodospirillaceae bacterium]
MTTNAPAVNAGDFKIEVTSDGTGRTETITLGRLVVTRKHGSVITFIDAKGMPRCRRQSPDLIEFIDAIVAGTRPPRTCSGSSARRPARLTPPGRGASWSSWSKSQPICG